MIELTIGRGTYRFAVLFVDQTFGTSDEPLLSLCDLLLTPRAVHCGESSVQYIRSPTQVVNMYSSSRTTRDTELNDRDGCRGDNRLC